MRNANAVAIAGGAIAASLIDKLIAKGVLTTAEGREVLMDASKRLQPFLTHSAQDAFEGARIIGEMLQARPADSK